MECSDNPTDCNIIVESAAAVEVLTQEKKDSEEKVKENQVILSHSKSASELKNIEKKDNHECSSHPEAVQQQQNQEVVPQTASKDSNTKATENTQICSDQGQITTSPISQQDSSSTQQQDELRHKMIEKFIAIMAVSKMITDFKPAQILEHLFLGSIGAAMKREVIETYKITHVLCVMDKCKDPFPQLCTYKHLPILDTPTDDISKYFEEGTEFIQNAVKDDNHNVLVHCFAGKSRSTSIILAYLMKYQGMSLDDAFTHVKKTREIAQPNTGFMDQLKKYEATLKQAKSNDAKIESDDQMSNTGVKGEEQQQLSSVPKDQKQEKGSEMEVEKYIQKVEITKDDSGMMEEDNAKGREEGEQCKTIE